MSGQDAYLDKEIQRQQVILDARLARIEELDRQLHEAIGWMYAYACTCVDENVDIRTIEAPEIFEECLQTIRHKAREKK